MLSIRAHALRAAGRIAEAREEITLALQLRHEAGGMETHDEAGAFLIAHELGVPGTLARGAQVLRERAGAIRDPEARRAFLALPSHVRLLELAR